MLPRSMFAGTIERQRFRTGERGVILSAAAFQAERRIWRGVLLKRRAIKPYCVIWKFLLLISVPPGVVTTTGPVVAPMGTTAVMYVSETTLKLVAARPL